MKSWVEQEKSRGDMTEERCKNLWNVENFPEEKKLDWWRAVYGRENPELLDKNLDHKNQDGTSGENRYSLLLGCMTTKNLWQPETAGCNYKPWQQSRWDLWWKWHSVLPGSMRHSSSSSPLSLPPPSFSRYFLRTPRNPRIISLQ